MCVMQHDASAMKLLPSCVQQFLIKHKLFFLSHKLLALMFKCPDYSLFKLLENSGVAWWKHNILTLHANCICGKQHKGPQQLICSYFRTHLGISCPCTVSKNGVCNPHFCVGSIFCTQVSDIFKAMRLFTLPSN